MSDDFDIENLLRATLSEQARQAPDGADLAEQIIAEADHPRPVRDLRGPRRWRGWTLPAVTAGAVAAVVAIVIGLAQVHRAEKPTADHRSAATHPHPSTPVSTGYSALDASPTPSASAPPTSPSTGLPGGAVGPNFHAVDLTFAGPQDGWALGSSGCLDGSPGTCPTILHTRDGGASWGSIPIPSAPVTPDCGSLCVTNLRFANAKVGYAFGPGALFMTTDGGATWGKNHGDTSSLEVANGNALRITGGMLQIAVVGSQTWTPAAVPPTADYTSQLVRASHDAYALSVTKAATGSGPAGRTVLASTNDGRTWDDRGNPCDQASPAIDADQLAAGADGSLTVLCQDGSASKAGASVRYLVTSIDGGETFTSPTRLSATAPQITFAAASASVLFYVDQQLYRSTNGGQTWSATDRTPARAKTPTAFLGFESPSTGRWVAGDGSTIWTTTDAGANWTPHVFN